MQPFLEITDISESDGGEYVCAATNDEGSTYSEPININITCKNGNLTWKIDRYVYFTDKRL